jgi:3-hydroxyisobutyrate dehydrogenase-like beta-hydroxyacid dehydrogenase
MPAERIGFLGLGIMGSRMAANVARAGYSLAVWTHTPGKAERWAAEHGAEACATPAEVAARSEIVLSMVIDGAQVASVLLGDGNAIEGAIEGARPGTLCVDCSTIGPPQTRAIGAALKARGVEMLDAPVSGSSPRAEAGTLTIMVGGEEQAFGRAKALLETMGERVVHVGELGQGEALKLINNSLAAANAAAVAEALVLGAAAGIGLDDLVEVIGAGSGSSLQLELKSGPMRDHDYATLFKAGHMLKDVDLCLREAEDAGVPFPAAAHARELLVATVGRGHGEDDYAAMIEAVEGLAGRRL